MKPTVMILGTYHMDNPGADAVNFEADDVLSTKRQRELQHLIEQLARFNPTQICSGVYHYVVACCCQYICVD